MPIRSNRFLASLLLALAILSACSPGTSTPPSELGFTNPPATADEFRQQACAANAFFRKDADPQNDGYGGWIVDTDSANDLLLDAGLRRGVLDGNGSYGFQTDPNLAALEFLKTLYDDNCAWLAVDPTNPKDISHGPYFDQFAKRLALFVAFATWLKCRWRTNSCPSRKTRTSGRCCPSPVRTELVW